MAKVLFVCSSGGHLDQMLVLLPEGGKHEIVVATFLKPDAVEKLGDLKAYALKWPTNRSWVKVLQNGIIAVRVLMRERPDLIISSGAAAAVPFFFLGKVVSRTQNIFVECIDRIDSPTLTAKLVRPVTDLFVCQWPQQLAGWKNRVELERSR